MNSFPFRSILIFAIPIIIQIPIIFGVIYFLKKTVQKNNENASSFTSNRGAMRILDERFAKGEIDEMTYSRKKEMLKRQ